MNNYELAKIIVDDIMKKINSGEQVFYMEHVRSVESLLKKHVEQQAASIDTSVEKAFTAGYREYREAFDHYDDFDDVVERSLQFGIKRYKASIK